ncbi:malate dehydrogenase, partial [Myxococcota bacterium]|nr:malate dehydrogenase [Myxococcota bacterium]
MENPQDKLTAANQYYAKSEKLHRFFKGKVEVVSKCSVNELNDFSLWYTPGVAEPCREIAKNPDTLPLYTNQGNAVAIVSDGTRVLGLGNI